MLPHKKSVKATARRHNPLHLELQRLERMVDHRIYFLKPSRKLYQLLSPYFANTVMVQNTAQLAQILNGNSLHGETFKTQLLLTHAEKQFLYLQLTVERLILITAMPICIHFGSKGSPVQLDLGKHMLATHSTMFQTPLYFQTHRILGAFTG